MPGRDFEKQMESVIRLFLPLFVAILLAPHAPALAFDGHDGGFDGAWDNDHDGGEDTASHDGDEGGENSHAGHDGAEGQSHHAQDDPHHEHHPTGRDDDVRHHEKRHHHGHDWPIWAPAWGFSPGFGFGFGGLGLEGFGGPGFGAFGYGTPYYPPGYYDSRPAYNPPLYPPLYPPLHPPLHPPMIFQSAPPPVYIQKQNAGQPITGAQPGYWHYCRDPEGYYPQVQECPDGWESVAPQAPEISVPDSRK